MTEESELERWRNQLFEEWRIGEKSGLPTPEYLKIYELVLLEMRYRADNETSTAIANAAAKWVESRNPSYLDFAIVACAEKRIEPPLSLLDQIAIAAKHRIDGTGNPGNPAKAKKQYAKNSVYVFIANLIHSGNTLEHACMKGAIWYVARYPKLKPILASTLEKYYVKEWRSKRSDGNTVEESHHSRWENYKTDADKLGWREISEKIPSEFERLKGNRRQ
jgi:hypothetical protein